MSIKHSENYYEILELPRTCSQEEISESYRRLSLKYHPKLSSPENSSINEYKFQQLGEAYEVLSDPNKKGIFDIYGKEGLYNGIIDKNGNLKGGYKFLGNAHEIFEKFMGTSNPFTLVRDGEKMNDEFGSAFGSAYGGQKQPPKDDLPPIKIDLECSLEELYNGCVKNVKYNKNILGFDQRTTQNKEASIDVEIFKGYDKNTIIEFKGKGNEAPGMKNSDLIISIKEKKDDKFRRVNKNDLMYIQKITLAQALNSEPVKITTLDNRKIAITMDEIISPQTVKVVKGEGIPLYKNDTDVRDLSVKKGDLFIKFDIEFPEYIEPEKKEEIIRLLKEDEEELKEDEEDN